MQYMLHVNNDNNESVSFAFDCTVSQFPMRLPAAFCLLILCSWPWPGASIRHRLRRSCCQYSWTCLSHHRSDALMNDTSDWDLSVYVPFMIQLMSVSDTTPYFRWCQKEPKKYWGPLSCF